MWKWCHLGCFVENEVSPCSRGEAVRQHSQCMLCSKKWHGSALPIGNEKQRLDSLMCVLWSLLISYFRFSWLQFYYSIWIRMKSVNSKYLELQCMWKRSWKCKSRSRILYLITAQSFHPIHISAFHHILCTGQLLEVSWEGPQEIPVASFIHTTGMLWKTSQMWRFCDLSNIYLISPFVSWIMIFLLQFRIIKEA